MTGLHAALTALCDRNDRLTDGNPQIHLDASIPELRRLLDAHPETAPVISRDRLAGEILGEWMRHVEAQTRAAPIDHCLDYADAVIASGMFRSVDEVKAETLQEAAAAWDQADADGSIGDFADVHYRAGQNLPSLWLHHRADALTATPEGSDKA